MDRPVYAALPDSSWYAHAKVGGHRYHAMTNDQCSACDRNMPLNETTARPIISVPARLRCRRSACSRHFPQPDSTRPEENPAPSSIE